MIITKKTYLTEVNSFINLYAEKKKISEGGNYEIRQVKQNFVYNWKNTAQQ